MNRLGFITGGRHSCVNSVGTALLELMAAGDWAAKSREAPACHTVLGRWALCVSALEGVAWSGRRVELKHKVTPCKVKKKITNYLCGEIC